MLRKVFCLIAVLVILPTFTATAAAERSSFLVFVTSGDQPTRYVTDIAYCDDANSTVNSDATEILNNGIHDDGGVVLPPDPGEEGKLTLLGIDSDGDGVRDDIQRYIYFTYPDDEKLRLGLTCYAKEFQGVLADADDRETSYEHAIKIARHRECLWYIKEMDEDVIDILNALLAEILNTHDRSIAYITYSDNLRGKNIRRFPQKEWKDSCSFDVDTTGGDQ
ncbi:MAG: hypothetical protein D8M57_06575 [Candidatus Scalindua sp. AMX11]|nr:MAG: hypothetical protein DWQ00_13820 [Candidatus Scalindua sp.]NOG85372.1 hypothetical protein [Planctomycetota bacterium]RZV83971.1 MAG: hypothetical protein EX341_08530 [Candidatus Scalindua sp. SCAELEC01]TDE65746.1 MAG: hypothetical protein D8M57_06575 [Candidatus Scalindua sp. AMX11]GJQ59646.1 MAG: hypothetical protein SCALA701_24470 [Candidatus Scalindua sp.]